MPSDNISALAVTFRFWIPIVGAALMAVAGIAYYRTTPEVGGRFRWLLVALRACVFVSLLAILMDPRWVRTVTHDEPARVIALVDRSASMGLKEGPWQSDDDVSRLEVARGAVEQVRAVVRDRDAVFEDLYFSNGITVAGDTVSASGQGTDIVGALLDVEKRFEGENVAAIFLFSDGVDTEEKLLRRALPEIPVLAVGLGDTSAPEDVRIVDVDYAPVVRVPSRTTVTATIGYSGNQTRRIMVKLVDGERTVFQNDTVVTATAPEIVQRIPLRFREPGRNAFSLRVEIFGQDAEPANNQRDVVIEAEKARARIIIVDLTPGWELHFLAEFLRRDQTLDYELVTMPRREKGSDGKIKSPGGFVASLVEADAVVLGSVTDEFFTREVIDALTRFVGERGGGLLVLPGESSLYEHPLAWGRIADLLPVRGTPPFLFNLQYTSLAPGPQAGVNPITANLLPLLSQTEWQERSPLLGFYGNIAAKNVSEVLLSVKGRAFPAFTYQTVGKGRVAAFSAGPLWRWKFLSDGNAIYDEVVSRILDVLSRGEDTDKFVLSVKKNVFEAGETPDFSADIFNEKMQPVTGAPVRLEISRVDAAGAESPLQQLSMRREGVQSTRFTATVGAFPPGKYVARGSADLGDRTVISKPVLIQVSNTSVEYARVHQDRDALISIARRSGGDYLDVQSVASVAGKISLTPRVVPSIVETTFRTSVVLFVLILALLSMEWMLRKRAGMI